MPRSSLFALTLLAACSRDAEVGPGTPAGSGPGTPSGASTGATGGGGGRLDPYDLVTDRSTSGLRLSIDHVTGREPVAAVRGLVEDELAELVAGGHLVKPGGISIVLDESLVAGDPEAVHTFDELAALLDAHAGPDLDGDVAVVHGLWVDGHYENDTDGGRVLGFAWGGNRLVLLPDNLAAACDQVLSGPLGLGLDQRLCEVTEASVVMHELGHLFGLVDNGLPMVTDHRDPNHGNHDSNADCLMYWAADQSTVVEALAGALGLGGGPQVLGFDDACLDDLAAAQAAGR